MMQVERFEKANLNEHSLFSFFVDVVHFISAGREEEWLRLCENI